jgi:hypothetical protein
MLKRIVASTLAAWMWTALALVVSGAEQAPSPDQKLEKPKALALEERRARIEELRERNPEAFEKMREELKNLPPAERQRRLREFREKQGLPSREDLEKRREEFKNLPPEEREAKLKELRERIVERRKAMTPDERKVKRQEIKSRFDKQLRELEKKKTSGSLTAPESKRLERLEVIEQRFKQAQERAGGIATPAKP